MQETKAKKFFSRLPKGRTFYLLMASFLSILLLCCFLISAQFIRYQEQTLDNTWELYQQLAEKAMDSLTLNINEFQEYISLLTSYSGERLTELAAMDYEEAEQASSSMLDDFQRTFMVGNKISGTIPYLYFEKSGYTLGINDHADVMQSDEITGILGLNPEDWAQLISTDETPLAFIQQTEQMTFARLMLSQEILPGVYLIFAVPMDTILDRMSEHYLPEGSMIMMITPNNQFILNGENIPALTESGVLSYENLSDTDGYLHIQTGEDSSYLFLFHQQLDDTAIALVVLIPDNLYPQFYSSVRSSILISVLLYLTAGVLISWFLAARLYRPVAVLLKNLPISETADSRKNDLASIQSFVNMLQTRAQTQAEQLERQNQVLANSLFLRLLSRTLSWNDDVSACLEEAGFPVFASRYVLFKLSIQSVPDLDDASLDYSVFDTFSFHQTLTDALSKQGYCCYCISCRDFFLGFVDLSEKELPDFEQLLRLHQEDYPMGFLIAVSAPHTALTELPDAMLEADAVTDELMMENQMDVASQYSEQTDPGQDAAARTAFGNRFLRSVQVLGGSMQSTNYPGALEEARALRQLLGEPPAAPFALPSLLHYIQTTVRICANSLNRLDPQKADALWQKYPLHRTLSCSEFFRELEGFLQELPQCIAEDQESSQKIQKIAAYLRENYADSNLSAGSVAEQFSVSMSWLSIHFKEETGTGFLDYLHGCRLARAKELLQTSSRNIRDIALEVGYTNSATFSRAFSRYEGVTPSWYRQQHA